MKNKIISLIAAGFLLFTPQLALAAENGEKEKEGSVVGKGRQP